MKKAVHFGAGNIGRGFIGEILHQNDFEITFVDVNATVIDALNVRHSYEIGIADQNHEKIAIDNVRGINNRENPEEVVDARYGYNRYRTKYIAFYCGIDCFWY